MAHRKAYDNHVEKLVKCLPMDDAHFITALSAQKLLPGDTENKVEKLSTQAEKASYFLNHVIKTALDIDETSYFEKFLTIMQNCDYEHVQKLVGTIKLEINNSRSQLVTSLITPKGKRPRNDTEDSVDMDKLKKEDVFGAYTYLLSRIENLFETMDFTKLKSVCMLRGVPLPPEFKQQISEAKNLYDILTLFDNTIYCNFFNVRLLKEIASNICHQEIEKAIKIYEDHVYSSKISVVNKYFTLWFGDKKTMSMIEVEVNMSYKDSTVKQIIDCNRGLEKLMGMYSGAISAINSRPGCLRITIVIPLHCSLHAFEMAKKNFIMLRQYHIQYLEFESFSTKVFAFNCCNDENTHTILSSNVPKFSNPSEIINHYYTYLEGHMDADAVSHMMHYNYLITDDDYEAITAAPNDRMMNTVILQYIKAMDMSGLIRFCDILKGIETQRIIGDHLYTLALQAVTQESSSTRDPANSMSLVLSSDMVFTEFNQKFYAFVDNIILRLSESEVPPYSSLSDTLSILMASDSDRLFTDQFLKRITSCKSLCQFKSYLLPFITWLDHSILSELVKASDNDYARGLLDYFDSMIDDTQPITSYPIPAPGQLIIPLYNSKYTLFAIKYYDCTRNILSLKQVKYVKSLIEHAWKITSHAIQLVAACKITGFLYWMIPECIASLIEKDLNEVRYELWQHGCIMISLLPKNFYYQESDCSSKIASPFNFLLQVDATKAHVACFNKQQIEEQESLYRLYKAKAKDLQEIRSLNQHKAKHLTDVIEKLPQVPVQVKKVRHEKGFFRYMEPPLLPSHFVERKMLLNEITTKLLQATNDPNKYETTLTITGAGGFGKTAIVLSLCHHPVVKEKFTDGFVFIELGPQATDPSIKLRTIYNLLTDEQCDINFVEQKINQLTRDYYRNLLVIMDDVWHVEDAEPLVKAFSNCKIILTTRMNDVERYIPSQHSAVVGPMTQDEAISLLTNGVIDSSQLSHEDVMLLNTLVQNVHQWPLLLSLIRGQLVHNMRGYHLSCHAAIQNVLAKLHFKGLMAFDRNNIETIKKSRNLAVKACIETTLELLPISLSNKIKSLILFTGIGASLPTAVLNKLWNVSEQEAEDTVDVLWAYGLVQYTDIQIFPSNNTTQHCVEVHAVIIQYIIECMDTKEVIHLSQLNEKMSKSIYEELMLTFQKLCEVHDPSSLTAIDYLKYKINEINYVQLPYYIRIVSAGTIVDPHRVILILQQIKDALMVSPSAMSFLHVYEQIIAVSKQILVSSGRLCRKLNESTKHNIYIRNYDKVIQTVEEYIKNYPLYDVVQQAVILIKKILPYCDGVLLHYTMIRYENLQTLAPDYHINTTLTLPFIKLYIELLKQITSSLLNESSTKVTYNYIRSGKFHEEQEIVRTNYYIKLREVAPNYIKTNVKEKFTKVVNYQPPPPVQSRIAIHHTLINEIVGKLCVGSHTYGATLILTGTVDLVTIVKTLCQLSVVKETFSDGFIFTTLGTGDIDPINKLSEMYKSLTGKQCDNNVEENIQILTSDH